MPIGGPYTVLLTVPAGKPLLVGLFGCSVAESFDEPLAVVELDEGGDGGTEVVYVAVGLGPQALLFEGLDPPFGAVVTFWLTG